MLKMSAQMENIVNAYKTLSKIPSIAGGSLNRAGNKVTAKWSVRAVDKGKNAKYCSSYVLDSSLKVIAQSDFGTDVSNELLSSVSPQETYKAVVREETNGKDAKKKQYLEVWSKSTLQHCIDLTALDLHGDVYADSEFGCLDWTQDESAIVYVAERKQPKLEAYLKRKAEDKAKNDGSGETAPRKGEEYLYRQDWGEQLVGKFSSVIVICRLPDESVTVLDHLPSGDCPGQLQSHMAICQMLTHSRTGPIELACRREVVRFTPDGRSVVGVAWSTEPRRLGLIFCTNRPSYIFSLTLAGEMKKLSSDGLAVRSPRFTPTGNLLWLQRAAGGPHHACHQLVVRKHDSGEVRTVIDIVQKETAISNNSFTGVYCQGLPKQCFTTDGRLVFSTPQDYEVRSYVVDIDGGSITDISKSFEGSLSVLDVRSDVVLAAYSSQSAPGQLFVAKLPPKGSEADISWARVSEPAVVPPVVASATSKHLELTHDSADDVKSFSALYFAPATEAGRKVPLVVWPHGGPHSNFVNSFSVEAALFSMMGFASLQINYRGSTGAGQASLAYLPGRCGEADVKDCAHATNVALSTLPIDPRNVFLTGGSHGGFLVTHLSGQYPDLYAAVVTRNPVTDIATMYNYTDINDWCAVEAGFEFTESGPLSEEHLLAMRRCSPLAHVHKVRAPTAVMLGSGDKRVPHYQGLEYARRLKANGVETRVYMYEDNHSLSSLPAEMDNLINGALWFLTHLKQ